MRAMIGRTTHALAVLAVVTTGVFAPAVTTAHSAPEKAVALHGGIAATVGDLNLELVAADGALELYVRDRHNRPVDAREYAGSALVWAAGGAAVTLAFRSGDAGVLEAEGPFSRAAIERVIVTVTAPGQEPATAWFKGFSAQNLSRP